MIGVGEKTNCTALIQSLKRFPQRRGQIGPEDCIYLANQVV